MNNHVPNNLDVILDRQKQAWLVGSKPSIDELLRDSSLSDDPEVFLDLIYNEVVVREELGENPSLDEYLQRYPNLQDDLRLHFEVHRAVHEKLLLHTRRAHDAESVRDINLVAFDAAPKLTDYEIVSELGRGGMGVVYKARHRRLKRLVALKMFQTGRQPTPRELERFGAEAEAVARLQHPNIVQVFEVGEANGLPFLALELADNGTLAHKLQAMPLAPLVAAELIETLARAVQHAHEHQIVHRDLKPANVLFTLDGTPKITDFGLAKLLEDDANREATRSGEPIGTPRYMSPEQAAGQRDQIGPATDVYALGTILYECMTGQAPFLSASVVETVQKIRNDEPVPPRRLQPAIPRDLETICLHCLHKQPGRRYASAAELANDLQRYLRGEPIRARRTPTWERVWMWCRRHPAPAVLAAVAAVLMFTGIAILMVRERRIASARTQVVELVKQGQDALGRDDVQTAKVKFEAALSIVLAEPALRDQELFVRGWLDEGVRNADRHRWAQRQPPPTFEVRRDEAFVQCGLLNPKDPDAVKEARRALHAAVEFAVTSADAEPLILMDADLLLRDDKAADALATLDGAKQVSSRLWHERRADCLDRLGKKSDADQERALAQKLPQQQSLRLFLSGVGNMQRRDSAQAARDFDRVLHLEANHFSARFLEAACLLRLNEPAEAKIGLTACIGQRPAFAWNYILRGHAHTQLGEHVSAAQDLHLAARMDPKGQGQQFLTRALSDLQQAVGALPEAGRIAFRDARIQTDAGPERIGDLPLFRQ